MLAPHPLVLNFIIEEGSRLLARNREQQRRWRAAHPEQARTKSRDWAAKSEKNAQRLREAKLEWERRNWEAKLEKGRRWNRENREKKAELRKAWRAANPERANELARTRCLQRRQQDPNYKLRIQLRNRINTAIARAAVFKSGRSAELLGCTIAHARAHLEAQFKPGMTWENYGPEWHVDHIRPCASFDLSDPAQQRACFHYTNLQPMWAAENLSKGARYAA